MNKRRFFVFSKDRYQVFIPYILMCICCDLAILTVLAVCSSQIDARAVEISGLACVLIAIVGLGLSMKTSQRFLGPMVAIQRHIAALTEGRYEEDLVLRNTDAFHDLAAEINTLTRKLRAAKQAGFTLIEVLVSLAVVSISTMAILSLMEIYARSQQQMDLSSNTRLLKYNFLSILQDPASWNNTVASPFNASAFACLTAATPTTCPLAPQVIPVLLNAKGDVFYDARIPSAGFTASGSPCTGFAASGSSNCPLRFDFSWTPKCPSSGACVNPMAEVDAVVTYAPSSGSLAAASFNPKNYGFTLLRAAQGSSRTYAADWATLGRYHNGCTGCSTFNFCVSACNRICGLGCSPAMLNCVGNDPGFHFAGGTFVECNTLQGGCVCTL